MENYKREYIKPFSKEWWTNFWYYHKPYVVIGGIVLIVIIFGISQCAFQEVPDMAFTYIGDYSHFAGTSGYVMEDRLAEAVPDLNGDGKHVVRSSTVYINRAGGSANTSEMYDIAALELAGGEAVAFFFDEAYLQRTLDDEYYDMTAWAEEYGIDETLCVRDSAGRIVGIALKDNALFGDIDGLNPDGLYIVVRFMRDNENSEWDQKWYQNGVDMARYIVSEGAYQPQ